MYTILFQMLAKLCNQGFDDALTFLQKNNLINCKKCLMQRRSFALTKNNINEMAGYDPLCFDCKWNNAVIFLNYTFTYFLNIPNNSFVF